MEIVVGGAVIRDARVLGARRTAPVSLAGRWEFPGGKVEAGETAPQALRRELAEELAFRATVGEAIGRAPLGAHRELVVYACTVAAGEPTTGHDHDLLHWFGADELVGGRPGGRSEVEWLEADRALLADVAQLLAVGGRN